MGDDLRLKFEATSSTGEVSAILRRPEDARALYVLAHGAGAGMQHPFMDAISQHLAHAGIATFRYQFPYMEAGRRAPSPRPILLKTVRSAIAAASEVGADLPMFAGGKSMGGRMTSLAASSEPLPDVRGLVFLGFPLHAMGKPSAERGDHLSTVGLPMFFVQGTRDRLADLSLLKPVIKTVRPSPTLHVVDDGDHSLHVPKRSGRTDDQVLKETAAAISSWIDGIVR